VLQSQLLHAALGLVLLLAVYFLAFGAIALAAPAQAQGFLQGFAQSARAHRLELAIRILVGAALLIRAPLMLWPSAFSLFGALLLLTSSCLLLLPWRWHQRFARHTVPRALPYLAWIGMCSLILGAILLYAALRGPAGG